MYSQNLKKIDNIISKIAKKLRITNGTIKGDLIVRKNKIIVVELR